MSMLPTRGARALRDPQVNESFLDGGPTHADSCRRPAAERAKRTLLAAFSRSPAARPKDGELPDRRNQPVSAGASRMRDEVIHAISPVQRPAAPAAARDRASTALAMRASARPPGSRGPARAQGRVRGRPPRHTGI